MSRWQVVVAIRLKAEILDPAGQAVGHVLQQMGFGEIAQVRLGRLVDLEVEAESRDQAVALASEAARRLLANPVLEVFAVTEAHEVGGRQ
jgi:phosphoribosylformylglycinamidine synthase PurS subunit